MKNRGGVTWLLEVMLLATEVIPCRCHQKGEAEIVTANNRADLAAKQAAKGGQTSDAPTCPPGPNSYPPTYSPEGKAQNTRGGWSAVEGRGPSCRPACSRPSRKLPRAPVAGSRPVSRPHLSMTTPNFRSLLNRWVKCALSAPRVTPTLKVKGVTLPSTEAHIQVNMGKLTLQ